MAIILSEPKRFSKFFQGSYFRGQGHERRFRKMCFWITL